MLEQTHQFFSGFQNPVSQRITNGSHVCNKCFPLNTFLAHQRTSRYIAQHAIISESFSSLPNKRRGGEGRSGDPRQRLNPSILVPCVLFTHFLVERFSFEAATLLSRRTFRLSSAAAIEAAAIFDARHASCTGIARYISFFFSRGIKSRSFLVFTAIVLYLCFSKRWFL